VLKLSGAKDPDEYIQKFGPDRFRRVLEESRTGFEHKADRILSRYDLGEGTDKIRASNELCAMVAEYSSPIEREVYLAYASSKLELPIDVLRNSVEQYRRRNRREQAAKDTREAQATVKNFGDRVNPEAAQYPRAAAAEEAVIGLLLIYEEYRNAVQSGAIELREEHFVTDFYRRVFTSIMRRHATEEGLSVALMGAEFTPDEMGRIEKSEVSRRQLSQYGPEVFRSSVEALKNEKKRLTVSTEGLDAHLQFLREKKLKKSTIDTNT
jgi:DNA primase